MWRFKGSVCGYRESRGCIWGFFAGGRAFRCLGFMSRVRFTLSCFPSPRPSGIFPGILSAFLLERWPASATIFQHSVWFKWLQFSSILLKRTVLRQRFFRPPSLLFESFILNSRFNMMLLGKCSFFLKPHSWKIKFHFIFVFIRLDPFYIKLVKFVR